MYFSEVRFDVEELSTKGSHMNMAEQLVELLLSYKIKCTVHSYPSMYYAHHRHGFPNFSTFWEGLTTVICNDMIEMITSEVMIFKKGAQSKDVNKRIAQYVRFQYNMSIFGCVNSH